MKDNLYLLVTSAVTRTASPVPGSYEHEEVG